MNIYNAKNNSMPEQVLENKENIELLNTGKQDKLVAGEGIIIDPVTNMISASGGGNGSGDIVIYDNENGAFEIGELELEIGATYEMFITSVYDGHGRQYGQQKITIKLIPRDYGNNHYAFYAPVTFCYNTTGDSYGQCTIWIYTSSSTGLWKITNYEDNVNILIYKIIKKAV